MISLKERIEKFLQSLRGFESIDQVLVNQDPHGKARADYFLKNRRVIIEQKSLEFDPSEKVGQLVSKIFKEKGLRGYGLISVWESIKNYPDAQELNDKIAELTSRVVKNVISKADKQIKSTREHFNIPDSLGVLLLLNEDVDLLDPNILVHRIGTMLQQQNQDGSRRYSNIDCVVFVSLAHRVRDDSNTSNPMFCLIGQGSREARSFIFGGQFARKWARFNDIPYSYFDIKGADYDSMNKKHIQLDL